MLSTTLRLLRSNASQKFIPILSFKFDDDTDTDIIANFINVIYYINHFNSANVSDACDIRFLHEHNVCMCVLRAAKDAVVVLWVFPSAEEGVCAPGPHCPAAAVAAEQEVTWHEAWLYTTIISTTLSASTAIPDTDVAVNGSFICSVATLQTEKKIPNFSRRNCKQRVEQMHIY